MAEEVKTLNKDKKEQCWKRFSCDYQHDLGEPCLHCQTIGAGHIKARDPEIPRHKKRAPRHKPYAVEFITPQRCLTHGWETWGSRYTTLEQAQQAACDLQRCHARMGWQFRVAITQPAPIADTQCED